MLIRSEDATRRVCLWLKSMISLFYFLQYWTPWCFCCNGPWSSIASLFQMADAIC
jgi:hypothetical protein